MGLKLQEAKSDEEFRALFEVFRAGFTDPGTKLWPLFTADRPSNDQDTSKAVESEWMGRFMAWHRGDPTSTWLSVVDDNGTVLGGGRWSIYETSPYESDHKVEASWWPAGVPREIATDCLNQFLATSAEHMNKPHVFLNILFTHPEHRGKGAASLVMKWGLEHADRLGLESFIEATDMGKPVYEKFGFDVVETREWHLEKQSTEEGKKVEAELLPFQWWSMRRTAKV